MPSVLFVHNGVPGRFASLARRLRAQGWTGALINDATGLDLEGMTTQRLQPEPAGDAPLPSLLQATGERLRFGEAAAQAALQLRRAGFRPDLIIGHPGWGEMLFLREIFPDAPQIQVGEFFYGTRGTHFNFDPEFANPRLRAHAMHQALNASLALSHLQADRIVAPTSFQAGTFPPALQPLIRVIHEGVDTQAARRRPQVRLTLASGAVLDGTQPVITFINRRFEPLRGFHVFMRALPRLLAELPDAHVLMIGLDHPGTYNAPPANGSWKRTLLEELGDRIDLSRVHFVGSLSYDKLVAALSLSWAHVYLTYPFVLSWSLLDAMACECLIVGSDTAPVRDVIRHGENGLLVDFFDRDALADTIVKACRSPAQYRGLRAQARATVVTHYDRATVCEPMWMRLVEETVAR